MTGVLQSALDVTGACYLPSGLAAPGKPTDVAATAFRLEGFAVSVDFRAKELLARLAPLGGVSELSDSACTAFWRAVRDVTPLAEPSDDCLWRISVPPASADTVVARIQSAYPSAKWFLDAAGGLIWLSSSAAPAHIRQLLTDIGGHATLIRAPAHVRATLDVFHPQAPALAALSKRVKAQFDPSGVLNPGRMS
jgi:glycolate oxidase FAD binding subunit